MDLFTEDNCIKLISSNFHFFELKFQEAKSHIGNYIQFDFNNYKIVIIYNSSNYRIIFSNNSTKRSIHLTFSPFSRKINFQKSNQNNWHFIFNSYDIQNYIEKYQFDHPTYYDEKKNRNISISSQDYDNVFQKININKISDDKYIEGISINEIGVLSLPIIKISQFYLNIPDDNISNFINNDQFLYNEKRNELINKISSFSFQKKTFFWLSGGKKIGKTITIKNALLDNKLFYFNFKIIKSKKHSKDKKKIIYRECMNLFINKTYNEFDKFHKKIEKIKGYNKNIWDLLYQYFKEINEIDEIKNPIIILDDYDDIYMNEKEIMDENTINNISKYNKFKFIICGNGEYINKLMLNYLSGIPYNNNYEIAYYNDFDIILKDKNVCNLLYEVDKKAGEKEILEYLTKRYSGKEELLLKLITYEELIKINYEFDLKDSYLNELPIQLFKLIYMNEKKKIHINYLNEYLLNLYDLEIKNLILQKIKININLNEELGKLSILQDYIFERYIIGLIEINKLFDDMIIPKENIIKVEEIYNLEENNIKKKENIKDNYPILIKQNKQGPYYDCALIIKKKQDIYGILIQIGINKKKSYISNVFSYTTINYETLIKGLKKITNQDIKYLSLLFIFNKEKQDILIEKSDEYSEKLKQEKNHDTIIILKKKISSIYIGKSYTNEFSIPYLEFSNKEDCLYLENDKINTQEKFLNSFREIFNFQKEIKNNIDKLDYKDFLDDLLKFFDYENISEIKVHMEISNYTNVIKNLSSIFIIILILENIKLVIFNNKIVKYLLYEENIHKFKVLTKKEFSKKIKDCSFRIIVCEKIFNENKISNELQKKKVEDIFIKNITKRKVPSDYEKEKKKQEEEKEKYYNKNRKKLRKNK